MALKLEYPPGATPLDPDEAEGLKVAVGTRGELDEIELSNILAAHRWLGAGRARRPSQVAALPFLKKLHAQMFGATWRWAGQFRKTGKNIGCPPHDIGPRLHDLCDDVRFWLDHSTYGKDEVAARFHHRLTAIHPFPNGNGRHARLAADALLASLAEPAFTWGMAQRKREDAAAVRQEYLGALRAADEGRYAPLFQFVRS